MCSLLYLIVFTIFIYTLSQTCIYADKSDFMFCYYYLDISYVLLSSNNGNTIKEYSFLSNFACTVPIISQDGKYSISICDSKYVMVSNDYMKSFTNTFTCNDCGFPSISISGQYITIITDSGSNVYKSDNFGVTWIKTLTNSLCKPVTITTIERYMFIICDLTGYLSSNFGNTWSLTSTSTSSITISNTGQYATLLSTGSGLWTTTSYMTSWFNSLAVTLCSKAVSSFDFQYVFTTCSGGSYISNTFSRTWVPVLNQKSCSDPKISSNGKYLAAVCSNNIYISNDFGNSFNLTINGCNTIVMNPSGQYMSILCNLNQVFISNDFGNSWKSGLGLTLCNAPTISTSAENMVTSCSSSGYNNPLFSFDYGNSFNQKLCISMLNDGVDIMCDLCPNMHYGVKNTGLCEICPDNKLSLISPLKYNNCNLYGYAINTTPLIIFISLVVFLFFIGHVVTVYHHKNFDYKMLIGLLIFTGSPAVSSISHIYYILSQPFYSLGLLYVGLLIFFVPYLIFLRKLYRKTLIRKDLLFLYDEYDSFEKICYTGASGIAYSIFVFFMLFTGILIYELKLLPMNKIKNMWYYWYTGIWQNDENIVDLHSLNEMQAVYVMGQSSPWLFILLLNTILLENWSALTYISLISSILSLISSVYRYMYVKFILKKNIKTEPIKIEIFGIIFLDIDEGIMMKEKDIEKGGDESQRLLTLENMVKDLHIKVDLLEKKVNDGRGMKSENMKDGGDIEMKPMKKIDINTLSTVQPPSRRVPPPPPTTIQNKPPPPKNKPKPNLMVNH